MPLADQSAKRTPTLTPLPPQACKRRSGGDGLPYATAVLADSPVGYWKLDETSGAVMSDSSGAARDGTYNGSPAINQAPLINVGRSVTYNGSNFSRIPANPAFNANGKVSVEAWVKTTTVAGGEIVCSDETSGGRYFRLELTGAGKVQALVFDSGAAVHTYTGSISVNDGTRHQCGLSFDGSIIRVIVDGAYDGLGTSGAFTLSTVNNGIQIAERFSGGSDTSLLTGTVDEVSVYTSALTIARWAIHYYDGIA